MTRVDLFKEFKAEERMTRVGGERLRELILKKHPITLVFSGRPIASVSFLDEGIAKLALQGWSKNEIESRIHFDQMHPRDYEILLDLIKERLRPSK